MDANDTKTPENSIQSNILDKIMGTQTQSHLNQFQPISLVGNLLAQLKERDREILGKRFGLDGMEIETLESIGKKYTLTRERVRQIEKDSLSFLKKKKNPELEAALQLIFDSIKEHGSIISEEMLMQTMQVAKSDQKEQQAIKFLLSMGEQFKNLRETPAYYESWYLVGFDLASLQQVISEFMTILESSGKVLKQEELHEQFKASDFYKQHQLELTDKVLKSYLNIAKAVQINPFD